MIDYLIVSAELSLVALVAIACLRSAPARWRLGVALVALFVVVLPWAVLPAVPIPVTNGATTVLHALPLIAPFGTPEAAIPSTFASPSAGWELPLASVLTVASTLGLAVFAWLALRQRASVRHWHKVALDGDHLLEKMPEAVRRDCRMPYGMRRTLIDGKVPGMDGDWCRVFVARVGVRTRLESRSKRR